MFTQKMTIITLATSLCLWVSAASATATTYVMDKDHTTIGFSIKHMLTTVHGTFDDFDGKLVFDPKDLKDGKAEITIKADSIDTRNAKRDAHLKSPDFFDAAKFPTLEFKSNKILVKGKKLTINGMLKIHGVEKPITLKGEYVGTIKDPWGGTRATFNASGKLDRKDFGLTWNKALDKGGFLVGNDVNLDIAVEAIEQGKGGAASY